MRCRAFSQGHDRSRAKNSSKWDSAAASAPEHHSGAGQRSILSATRRHEGRLPASDGPEFLRNTEDNIFLHALQFLRLLATDLAQAVHDLSDQHFGR